MCGKRDARLGLLLMLMFTVAGAEDACQVEECPEAMDQGVSAYQVGTFLFSGIACALLVLDAVKKYILEPEEKTEAEKSEAETAAVFAAHEAKPETVEEEKITQEKVVPQAQAATFGALPNGPDEVDATKVEDEEVQTMKDNLGAVSDLVTSLIDCLRSGVDLHEPRDDLPASCKEKLSRISELGTTCNSLATEFDQCSVALVKTASHDDQPEAEQSSQDGTSESQLALQKCRCALKSRWTSIRRLFFCADLHLRNATAYQQYFFEADELHRQLAQFSASTTEKTSEDVPTMETAEDMKLMVQETDGMVRAIKLWEAHVSQQREESHNIAPVHLRTQPVQEPLPVKMVSSYRTPNLSLEEGEHVLLTNNEDPKQWEIQNAVGDKDQVPSACCLVPPPDITAIRAAARLKQSLDEAYATADALFRKRVMSCSNDVTKDFLENKMDAFKVLTPEHKEEFLERLRSAKDTLNTHFQDEESYDDISDMINTIKTLVQASSTDGPEDKVFLNDVRVMMAKLEEMMNLYKQFAKNRDNFKKLSFSLHDTDHLSDEWDTLEDAEQTAESKERYVDVNVEREHATQGGATSLMSASGEVRQKFSIRGVIDPSDGSEISMAEAVTRGIVNQGEGTYVNTTTNEHIPIGEAMSKGFIVVESTETRKARELTKAVGLVSVTFTRETRPYSIRRIRDPRNDEEITVDEAIKLGIFDEKSGIYRNPETKEEMNIENAIDSGALIVEYAEGEVASKPEVTTKTFAINAVLDRKAKTRLPFLEACQRGLIDKEAGEYRDNLTGEVMTLVEAGRRGFVRARIVTDESKLELQNPLSKKLSVSSESLNSEASSTAGK